MSSICQPLREITIADSLTSTCALVMNCGYTRSAFFKHISKHMPDSVTNKTMKRWMTGENIPRIGNFSAENMRDLIYSLLTDIYVNDTISMLSDYYQVLCPTFDMHELDILSDHQQRFNQLVIYLTDIAFQVQLSGTTIPSSLYTENVAKDLLKKQQHINADVSTIFEDVHLSVHMPVVSFTVRYFLRHVQNGKNEFLAEWNRIPLNRDYEFQKNSSENTYTVKIPSATPSIGFQFKCFAVCAESNAATLVNALKAHFNYASAIFNKHLDKSNEHYHDEKGIFPLVDISRINSKRIWFLLPNFHTYITFDPYINNYYSKP